MLFYRLIVIVIEYPLLVGRSNYIWLERMILTLGDLGLLPRSVYDSWEKLAGSVYDSCKWKLSELNHYLVCLNCLAVTQDGPPWMGNLSWEEPIITQA